MKHLITFSIICFIVAAVSGCIFSSDDDKEVKEGTVKGKVSMIITGEPVANVKVYLVNKDAAVDTLDPSVNRVAFVDSAFTDTKGEYSITSIPPGNYGVFPAFADSLMEYKFTPDASSGPFEFSMNGDAVVANYIAENLNIAGASSDRFYYKVYFKKNSNYYITDVTSLRRYWAYFIPYFDNSFTHTINEDSSGKKYVDGRETWGYTAVVWTKDNYFRFTVSYEEGSNRADKTKVFDIGYPLGGTPEKSSWEYDIATGTLTRLE